MTNSSVTLLVFKVFMKNLFSISSFFEGFKKGPKSIIKNILIILCFVYCIGAFGGMYGYSFYNSYKLFDASGYAYLMPLVAMLVAIIMILVFGFLSAASNYYTGTGEEQFLAMPLTPVNFFGAKFGVTFITDAVLGICIFAISSAIYGYNQHLLTKPGFYLGFISVSLALSVTVVFIIYLLLILFLLAFPNLRKRNVLTGFASVIVIVFAVGYSMITTRLSAAFDGNISSDIVSLLAQKISDLAQVNNFLVFMADALNGNWFSIIFMIGVFALVAGILVPSMAPLYIKTLNGFTDIKTKKIEEKDIQKVFKTGFKKRSVLNTLYIRDVKTVLREPSYFANGPLIIILMPLILVFSFAVGFISSGGEGLSEVLTEIRTMFMGLDALQIEKYEYYMVMILGGFSCFLGSSTCIASTSFSREGKSLYNLKAMPIESETIVLAKFWHALSYVFLTIAVMLAFFIFGINFLCFPLAKGDMLQMIVQIIGVGTTPSILMIFIDMFLDTANPKLEWENPLAAFKQNTNSIFSILISFGVIGICVGLCFLLPKNFIGSTIITAIFAVISAPVGSAYYKYAKKRIPVM